MSLDTEKLKQLLLEKKLLNEKQLAQWESRAKSQNMLLHELLFKEQVIPDEQLGAIVADLYGIPYAKLADQTIQENLLSIIPQRLAAHQFMIPLERTADTLKIATSNPENYELINFLENKTGLKVEVHYATPKDIQLTLRVYSRDVNEKFNELLKGALSDTNDMASLNDSSKLVDTIVLFAYESKASDIHLEPHKDLLVVRYRIDGILSTIAELPIAVAELITTRIKVLAKLRTDEHRAAQDGRFKMDVNGSELTLRVSIMPVYDGEKVVMRLLSSANQELNLEALGYVKENLEKVQRAILKTHGMLLMTGPTGSGKTTTLYSLLKLINSPEINIATIEDPIEYRLEGINQTQVNPKTNLAFADGMRSLVRQDPDVIMVGEIRDEETASVAINASLTGHLVLATLHTNDATSTLPRMLEMGVEGFLVAATAQLVIAQRLVRTVCDHCKISYTVDGKQLEASAKKFRLKENLSRILQTASTTPERSEGMSPEGASPTFTLYRGQGCDICNSTGYKGRTTIAEIMEVSDSIRKAIIDNKSNAEIKKIAMDEGMKTMFMDGMEKALQGITTLEEILRVMRS